jgi:type-F conjugative transfer system secretin TraK
MKRKLLCSICALSLLATVGFADTDNYPVMPTPKAIAPSQDKNVSDKIIADPVSVKKTGQPIVAIMASPEPVKAVKKPTHTESKPFTLPSKDNKTTSNATPSVSVNGRKKVAKSDIPPVIQTAPTSMQVLTPKVSVRSAEVIKFKNLDNIDLPLSSQDFNTLYIHGDKFTSVLCPPGSCETQINQDGTARLFVTNPEPFTVPVTTFNGLNINLFVIPQSVPGKTYNLMPLGGRVKEAHHWEESGPYPLMIINTMKKVMNGEPPEGYSYVSVTGEPLKIVNHRGQSALMQMRGIYRGDEMNVLVYQIQNNSIQPIEFEESSFFQKGVRSIALKPKKLQAMQSGWLYTIVSQSGVGHE